MRRARGLAAGGQVYGLMLFATVVSATCTRTTVVLRIAGDSRPKAEKVKCGRNEGAFGDGGRWVPARLLAKAARSPPLHAAPGGRVKPPGYEPRRLKAGFRRSAQPGGVGANARPKFSDPPGKLPKRAELKRLAKRLMDL